METQTVVGFAIFEAAAAITYLIAPRYSRWIVTLPAPAFITKADPASWTLIFRSLAGVLAALTFSVLPGGWVITVLAAIAAFGLTAWRYRAPR